MKIGVDKPCLFRLPLQHIISSEIDQNNPSCFIIMTPLRLFIFRCKHEISSVEWVNAIRGEISVLQPNSGQKRLLGLPEEFKFCENPLQDLSMLKIPVSNNGYMYSGKPLLRHMWLSYYKKGDASKMKKKVLKRSPTLVGRSSCSGIRLKDGFISRIHCKIVVEDGLPFLYDMGQARTGTKLNGILITKAPLAPGDQIKIGHTCLIFGISPKVSFTTNGSTFMTSTLDSSDVDPNEDHQHPSKMENTNLGL
eukprot:TRINITY_DN7352_c0_g1_i4.p1 TRINITY_DN7352_c0_g1~~TRINITY_DN7352_c0_g1_i4.p1  ORF type:complete len:251 (-),score=47.97 TRINITY_DN7352_c0_g1_i4:313-1065(-)